MFLYGNYKQIGRILKESPIAIEALQSDQLPQNLHYRQHIESEHAYLISRKKEAPEDDFACHYFEHLLGYHKAKLRHLFYFWHHNQHFLDAGSYMMMQSISVLWGCRSIQLQA